MASEYLRQSELPSMEALSFDERVGMMADAEWLSRENNRIQKLSREAKLRYPSACFADIDYRPSRKLDRAYIARLSDFSWVRESKNLFLTGCTGTGKTWLACAFGAEACRIGLRVVFYRVSRLLGEMAALNGFNEITKYIAKLKKANIMILDDWGQTTLTPLEGRLIMEVFEDRCGELSTIISAQPPVAKWHSLFEDPTVADGALDRIVHNSHRLELQGPSMRSSTNKDQGGGAPRGVQEQNTSSNSDLYTAPEQGGAINA
jgi:DNA replication protein DnaC